MILACSYSVLSLKSFWFLGMAAAVSLSSFFRDFFLFERFSNIFVKYEFLRKLNRIVLFPRSSFLLCFGYLFWLL